MPVDVKTVNRNIAVFHLSLLCFYLATVQFMTPEEVAAMAVFYMSLLHRHEGEVNSAFFVIS